MNAQPPNPELPDKQPSIADLLKQAAEVAASFKTPGDLELAGHVASVLMLSAKLIPQKARLQEILKDPNHPLFCGDRADLSIDVKHEFARRRHEQVSALVHFMSTIERSTIAMRDALQDVNRDAKKKALDESMRRLGIE